MSKTVWVIAATFLVLAGIEFGLLGARAAGVGPLASGSRSALAAGPPAAITLTASPALISCDGIATATVTASVTDANGTPVTDGTAVNFAIVALGTANPVNATTTNGVASSTITPLAGATAGVTIVVTADTAQASIRVDCLQSSPCPPPPSPTAVSPPPSPPSISPPPAPSCPSPPPPPTCRQVGAGSQGAPLSPPRGSRLSPPLPPCPPSPPGCDNHDNWLSPPLARACRVPTPTLCPLSPPSVSPPCGAPTPTPCASSPPSASPPCNASGPDFSDRIVVSGSTSGCAYNYCVSVLVEFTKERLRYGRVGNEATT